jgi:hypothetical protein
MRIELATLDPTQDSSTFVRGRAGMCAGSSVTEANFMSQPHKEPDWARSRTGRGAGLGEEPRPGAGTV